MIENTKFCKLILLFIFLLNISTPSRAQHSSRIKLGIDKLIETDFSVLEGKSIALLTNHSGRTGRGDLTVEAFIKTNKCSLKVILTPEHGFYTTVPAGKKVNDSELLGIPIHSLYGKNRKPSKDVLRSCDVVVVDLQDIGVRSYTYLSTLYNTMNECAKLAIPLILLDRPNPIGGLVIDGNTVDKGMESFVSKIPVSYIHGCTFGELALMINNEGWLSKDLNGNPLKCSLEIVEMENWKRWMSWEDTGLMWFPTSPHIPSPDAIRGAAMLGFLGELGVISIGIGTSTPFQYIGKPGFNFSEFEKRMTDIELYGLKLVRSKYQPFYGMYSGKMVDGYLLRFPLDNLFSPYIYGMKIIVVLRDMYPKVFSKEKIKAKSENMFKKVTGTESIFDALVNNADDKTIMELSRKGLKEFINIRSRYLLYKN